MGTLLVLVLIAVAAWVGWKLWKKPDANNDGVVDHKDAFAAVREATNEAKVHAAKALDVNKDGKVDLADVKVAGDAVKEQVKKVRRARTKKVD